LFFAKHMSLLPFVHLLHYRGVVKIFAAKN